MNSSRMRKPMSQAQLSVGGRRYARHLRTKLFKLEADIDVLLVPYRSMVLAVSPLEAEQST